MMTKNVDYEISVTEITTIIKRKWKMVGVIMLIFLIVCGGYKAISSKSNVPDTNASIDYERDMTYYEYHLESKNEIPAALKAEWKNICYDRLNNPIFSIDPYNCEYEQIVIRFGGDSGSFDWTVNNWVYKADNQQLFGSQNDTLIDYKSSLVLIRQTENSAETAVQLLNVDGFDTKKAADYLINHFKKCASEEQVEIINISKTSVEGFNQIVKDYQRKNDDDFNAMHAVFANLSDMNGYITQPANPQAEQGNRLGDILKYCIAGLILGMLLGIALAIVDAIRKREIISSRQVRDTFNIELLSDFSSNGESALDVLNANLDVMIGEQSKIALVVDDSVKGRKDLKWVANSDHSFVVCTDIINNPEMIEALNTTDGIVLGIELGRSKLEHIQRIILRADKLNRAVLGFVLL